MNFVKKYGRILLPLITPYGKNEEVDYDAYAKLIEYVIKNDVCDSLIVTGTTGEACLLTFDERVKLMETAVKAAAGRKPVIAGTGCASTKETIALTKKAADLGIELCLIVCPFYNKPTQEGLYLHYKAIAESVKTDILLYNIPIFVGINLEPETVSRLASIKNIVGVKDEAGINPTQMTEFLRVTPPGFSVYNGDDIMVLCGLAQGASGVVSGASHLIGKPMREMISRFLSGDIVGARAIHMALDPLFKDFCQNGRTNGIPIWKAAMNLCGLKVGPPRLPLAPATAQETEVMRKHLVRLGLL